MGRVIAPFGVRGWIKVKPYTAAPHSLLEYRDWWVSADSGWMPAELAEGECHASGLAVRLDGYHDRTQAEALGGREVGVARAALPAPASGEYYRSDLVGCEVQNLQGQRLGRVDGFVETGANDVLVVKGERERLIPWIDATIARVELERGLVTVDWDGDF